MELDIFIMPDGTIQYVYNDALAGLLDGVADTETRRASHVEPMPDGPLYKGGGWYVDMRPVGGPVIWANGETQSLDSHDMIGYRVGFKTRAEALAVELEWIKKELAICGLHPR